MLHARLQSMQSQVGAQSEAIAQRLAGGDAVLLSKLRIGAGIELQSSGKLAVVGDFQFGFTPQGSHHDASTLTLRAAGDLSLAYSLSSGFSSLATTAGISGQGASWRLVAGADLGSADVLAVRSDAPASTLSLGRAASTPSGNAPAVLLRSSTGDIQLASAGDIRLLNSAVRVYTTGLALDSASLDGWSRVNLANNQLLQTDGRAVGPFYDGAGDISLAARGSIVGSATRQYATDWWWRQTSLSAAGTPAAWWSRYDLFQQGVASFGGGALRASAGGDIVDLELSTPASGYSVQAVAASGDAAALPQQGLSLSGGSLSVQAGGDIVSGLFNAGGALASLQAGGSIRAAADTGLGKSHPGVQLFYGDTAWTLQAAGDLTIGQISNPALLSGVVQVSGAARSDVISGLDNSASLRALSLAGDLQLAGTRTALSPSSDPRNTASDAARQVPGRLLLAAASGDVRVDAPLLQRPVGDGSLALLAEGEVSAQRIVVAAASPPASPVPLARSTANLQIGRDWNRSTEAQPGLDTSSREAVQITARLGDVTLAADLLSARPLRISAGTDIRSTGSAAIVLQHQGGGELSLLQAGRDLVLSDNSAAKLRLAGPGDLLILAGRHVDLQGSAGITTIGNQDNPRLLPEGGANVTIVAGVDWGGADYQQALAQGLQLRAGGIALAPFGDRLYALAAQRRAGALQAAGVAALDASAYAALDAALQLDEALALADPAGWRQAVAARLPGAADPVAAWRALPAAQRSAAAAEIAASLPAWQQASAELARRLTGQPGIDATSAAAAWADFDAVRRDALALPLALRLLGAQVDAGSLQTASQAWMASLSAERRALLLHDALFDELRAAGRAAARLPKGAERDAAYQPAYAALALLYPGAVNTRPAGNISLASSQIKTQQGGDIRLLAPGGGVDAGALTGSTGKKASELGLLTVGGGNIEAAVRDDFAVNQSRVFTLARGDLLLWSSEGSIDAGRGARTVTGAPPPVTKIDANGNVVVDTSGSFSGSGIAVLDANSILDLYAPKGEISAGEAGIKPRGLAFVAADSFRGQLEGSGRAVGAPPPPPAGGETAALAAATQSVASASTGRSDEPGDDDERRKRKPRRQLLLEFLGFGEAE